MTRWAKFQVSWIEQENSAVAVVHLSGGMTSSPEAYHFLEEFQNRVREGRVRLVLDLDQVEPITSAGVGILAACCTSVLNAGGKITLSRVPARARAILSVVGLLSVMGDAASEEEAVRRVSD